ncbi:dihydrolipoyllysine-residue succinyltransferase component of 2-oxoglutarate dehydrogenase complex [Pasteurella bettyae]|nr:dihydrolipoyllysine-residue succinyltransferase component of 2-oxoglutarate dehydrogenase complex [Pasteurella bettyae]
MALSNQSLKREGATVVSKQLLGRVSALPVGEVTVSATSPKVTESKEVSLDDVVASTDTIGPSIRRLLAEHDLKATDIKGTGPNGRITREDVEGCTC